VACDGLKKVYQSFAMKRKRRRGKILIAFKILMNAYEQGGKFMAAATNVRDFPQVERDTPELSGLDRFLIWAGAKRMAGTTPKTNTASPMEWNKSVLSLTATLIAILAVLVGFVWNYAAMSTKFELQQQKILLLEGEIKDVKTEMNRFKEFQIKADSYRLGLSDAHGNEKEVKK
jgi:hypothetical protein